MKLVEKDSLKAKQKQGWHDYIPLIVIISVIFLTSVVISVSDMVSGTYVLWKSISYFMIGFFLTFSSFKLMDIKGFAEGYATYDLVAKRFFAYGYIYPFIELFFAFSMILFPTNQTILMLEIVVMFVSGVGVLQKLLKKEKFTCSCLGTFLKVPLTKVTLIEDFGMALLALLLLSIS